MFDTQTPWSGSDDFYQSLLEAHQGLTEEDSHAFNARLILLLAQHVRTCVADDLRAGSEEKLDELIKLLPKLMK